MRDVRDFVRRQGRLFALIVMAALLTFGYLVFCGNIRVDTEELINQPGTTLGWLTIGRYGLALLKRLLGLSTHHVIWSGVLFFLFFCLGTMLLVFAFSRYAGEAAKYPYWVFGLLYVTSNIWCFQLYFSVQQAEIALAMLLVALAAILAMAACLKYRGGKRWGSLFLALVLLVIGFGSYQALVAYYVSICAALFLLYTEHGWEENGETDGQQREMRGRMQAVSPGKVLGRLGLLLVHFLLAYGIYSYIANRWFMSTGVYMTSQRGWGRLSAAACIKNILHTVKNVLLMRGPENFSYYTIGILLLVVLLILLHLQRKERQKKAYGPMRRILWFLSLALLAVSPFLMIIYSGELLVARTQFALPFVAAFFGMYAAGRLRDFSGWGSRAATAAMVAAVLVTAVQVSYVYRLAYTDSVRYEQDVARTEELVAELEDACGGELPTVPVVFVGRQMPELRTGCIRTEMYGWSFYEWDYSEGNPTGATHRICGFVQAYTGEALNENATDEMKQAAIALADEMSDFPETGSVYVSDDMVVVRLSGVQE